MTRSQFGALAVVLVVALSAGCGGDDAAEVTRTVTVTAEVETQAPGSSTPAPAPASGEYPREVPIDEVTLPQWAKDDMQDGSPFPDRAIEWAPGIYSRAAEPIGRIEDYSTLFGPCPELTRFARDLTISTTCTT